MSCSELFQSMVVLWKRAPVDSSFCWIYSITLSCFLHGLSLYSLDDDGVGLNVLGRRQYILWKSVGFLGLISLLERMGVKNSLCRDYSGAGEGATKHAASEPFGTVSSPRGDTIGHVLSPW